MRIKGKGRRKIAMKKIGDESHLQVTFSKRRSGLFKKASELCILCDAEITLIVFSPGNKVYSFGHPSVAISITKYLTNKHVLNNDFADFMLGASRSINLQELNMEVTNVEDALAIEKVRKKQLNDLRKTQKGHYWWDVPDKDKLTLDQLELLKTMMEELHNNIQIEKHNNPSSGEVVTYDDNPTSITPFDGMGYVQAQEEVAPFDPRELPNPFTSIYAAGAPYDYMMANNNNNEFNPDIPNSLFSPNNESTIEGIYSFLGLGTSGTNNHINTAFNHIIGDGAGPSGTKNDDDDDAGPSGTNPTTHHHYNNNYF